MYEKNEVKDAEPDPAQRKRTAQSNLDTLVTAMTNHYEERYHLDADKIRNIIMQVGGWEEQLADCSTEGNGTTIWRLNNDLQNFLKNNAETIQPLIDEAIGD